MKSRGTQKKKKKPKEFVLLLNEKEIWYRLGLEKFVAKNFEGAIAAFDKAIKLKPDYWQAWQLRGLILDYLGRHEEALASYDTDLKFKPDDYQTWYYRGLVLGELERCEEALASFNKTLEFKPDDYQAWYYKGSALNELGRYEEALISCDTALKFKPDYYPAWSKRCLALSNLGRYEEAFVSYDKTLELKPDDYNAWSDRSSVLSNLGRYEEALASCYTALELKPDLCVAWNNRGLVLSNLGRHEEALASCYTAIELKPDFYLAWNNRGLALSNLGRHEEALASFDTAIKVNPNLYQIWHNRSSTLNHLGRYEEALASCDITLELKPDIYEAWHNRGLALDKLGRYEEALASFDKTLELKPDFYHAWNNRGSKLYDLGRYEEAIVSFDTAIELKSDFYQAWNNRGLALNNLGRYEEALTCFDTALELKSDFCVAWNNRGLVLSNLGRYEEAIVSFDTAIGFQSDFYLAWNNRGHALNNLGWYEEALASFDTAIEFNPDFYDVWNNRGHALNNLGWYEEAFASFDTAIKLKPDFYDAWNNRGNALDNLGQYEEALASFDTAIKLKSDFYQAWSNRGNALGNLRWYEKAIASFDTAIKFKPDFYLAWIGRGAVAGTLISSNYYLTSSSDIAKQTPHLNQSSYERALASFEEGLKYCPQDTHAEGWGRLNHAIGKVYYVQGRSESYPRPYWYQAANSFNTALKTLTAKDYPESHLEILQDLIGVRLDLGETDKAEELQRRGTDVLQNLLDTCKSLAKKRLLALKFAGFQQLTVDIAVQSGNWCAALELAEKDKNTCLHWLFGLDEAISFPQWRTMQQHLLNPTTAIVYWHLSPAALHTFILKYDAHSPIVITTPVENNQQEPSASLRQLQLFEDWLKDWNQHYVDYHSKSKLEEKSHHPWRVEMPLKLENLKNILNIPAIEQQLQDMAQLILIPHRDLHRFPLHALFSPQFRITYLPSAHLGISLQNIERSDNKRNSLLSIEVPNSHGEKELSFAAFESEAISQLFHHSRRIQEDEATKEQVETALFSDSTIFHFTGHGSYNLYNPKQSALVLTGTDKLTLEDICVAGTKLALEENCPKNLSHYKLVSLAACETAITGNQTITTEYVGLVSGFLSQGVAQVVSTLWVVESAASALVMIEFYRRWQEGKSAVEALGEATTWLRNLTVQQLKEWYKAILKDKNTNQSKFKPFIKTELFKLNKIESTKKLYEHPYYWAAFTITGTF